MQLPNLSGLRVAPRDRRRAPCATGGTFATLFVGRFINSAKMTKDQLRYEFGKVLGTLFLDRLKGIEGDGFSLTEDGNAVAFRYFLDSKVRRKIVFSEEFLNACMKYFEKPVLVGHLKNASDARMVDAWRAERDNAVRLFYDVPTLRGVDPGLRCLAATDAYYLTPIEGAPPRQYVQEFLCQPWYFRQFMIALDVLVPLWRSGELSRKSFADLATLSWEALGWESDPHMNADNLGSFTTVDVYQPTEEDLRLFQARFAYSTQVLSLVDSAKHYWELFTAFTKNSKVPPPATPLNTVARKGQAWAIFIKRDWTEKAALLLTLEVMWEKYTRTRSLADLVDLIQQFNGNHYFRDGNGRFSMLLIQAHMMATTGRLIYFWDHNPNGPCLAKYVDMLNRMPRIPEGAQPGTFDKEAIKQAFEAAYKTRCDGPVHEPMPDLESEVDTPPAPPVPERGGSAKRPRTLLEDVDVPMLEKQARIRAFYSY